MATLPVEFTDLSLNPLLLQGLDALGHVRMTPVQAQALPALLAGKDLIAQAPTGSGKTATFGLALLHGIDPSRNAVQALVLCPTRELADQVGKHIRTLATGIANLKLAIFTGGTALAPQLASLAQHAPQVVVGTPGRVQELLHKRVLDLRQVAVLVLDEADRMLDMGFEDAIRAITAAIPRTRQSLLFSATYSDAMRAVARGLTRDPVEVTVADTAQRPVIEQLFLEVEGSQKPAALAGVLLQHQPALAVVFCNTKREVDSVAGSLAHLGFSALALHGDMEQRDRDEVLVRFGNRSCNVLVASDVAARGLDIDDLAAVVNYDLPTDPETYLHRIGRTGRAGRSGLAVSLCDARELARAMGMEVQLGIRPQWQRPLLAELRRNAAPAAPMTTLKIDGGRSDKLRPGDIVGALTGDAGIPGDALGKIDIFPTRSYVAINRRHAAQALARLQAGKIKSRKFRVRVL